MAMEAYGHLCEGISKDLATSWGVKLHFSNESLHTVILDAWEVREDNIIVERENRLVAETRISPGVLSSFVLPFIRKVPRSTLLCCATRGKGESNTGVD